MEYLVITLLLIGSIVIYFKAAAYFNIVDVPNNRSSHQEVTIRGAGIIFPLAIVFCWLLFGNINYLLIIGLLTISAVSFADDLMPLPSGVRLAAHLVSVSIMLYAFNSYALWPVWLLALAYIIIIGAINAFNFMDGINGITGIYTLVTLLSMLYINKYIVVFTDNSLLLCPAIACIVFLYFNFRNKAACFAGDVGSISMAFWLIVLSIMVIDTTHSYKYLFMFSIYGVDAFFTIAKRIALKQNPLKAHRLHVYQLLVNNGGYSHRMVAFVYGVLQLLVNAFVFTTDYPFNFYLLFIVVIAGILYLFFERLYRSLPVANVK